MNRVSRAACILLLAVIPVGLAQAQGTGKPKTPTIPRETVDRERDDLRKAALLVSKSQFADADALLKPLAVPSVARVFVDWAPVPRASRPEYRKAVQQAMAAWNQAMQGAVTFQWANGEDDAQVRVLFDRTIAQGPASQLQPGCIDSGLVFTPPAAGQTGTARGAEVRIALNIPFAAVLHTPGSITHLAAQGLGTYLGLATTEDPTGVMGPDTHGVMVSTAPSAAEAGRARQLQTARLALQGFVRGKVAAYTAAPVIVVDKMEVDAGDVWRGDLARFVFHVKNTGDAPLEVDARPTCGCTVASYDKLIPPGGEGKIEAAMHTDAYRGRVTKGINVACNDPEKPALPLQITTTVKSVVEVLPTDNQQVVLKDSGATVQEFQLKFQQAAPVEIRTLSCNVPYASVKADRLPGGDPAVQTFNVTVTVEPEAPIGRNAFQVSAATSCTREPIVNFIVQCEKGILAMPPSVYMGSLTTGQRQPIDQTVTLVKHDKQFHVQGVASNDPNLKLRLETVKDGQEYHVVVTYAGGWPAGMVERKLTVKTDDPRQPAIDVPVIATVLPATTASR